MGYFSNGSEGDCYTAKYCENCIHWVAPEGEESKGCPVWDIHMLFNYTYPVRSADPGSIILDIFIPISKDELSNEQCTMFIQVKSEGQTQF